MTTPLAMAPLPDDQVALVKRLLTNATPEQRQWLSGYVAGFQAANDTGVAPSVVAVPKAKLTILYGSESGNAEALAAAARKAAGRLGFAARVLDMADATPAEIAQAGTVLVIASTWGEGDPPQRAEAFHAALMADGAPRLDGVRYAVLALGDRAYAQFCATGRQFDARFAALGATRVAALVECDLDYKRPAAAWTEATLGVLAETAVEPGAAVIHVDFGRAAPADAAEDAPRVVQAEVSAHINLNSSQSDIETYHLELSLAGSGLTYQPGDAIGFTPSNDPELVDEVLAAVGQSGDAALRDALWHRLDITTLTGGQIAAYAALTGDAALQELASDETRAGAFARDRQLIDLLAAAPHVLDPSQLTGLLRPLPPRYYSVASSQRAVGEEAHLLIAKVGWDSHGRARKGVASTDAAARRGVGATMPISVKPNVHFRLPNDPDVPIIMIGPGTGVAPFRAFLQEREAIGARGRSWLFFGARRFTHDFLYQLEWQDWLSSGVLSRIDLAFSRDQREKIYVQHRMWQARRELYAWLRDGAWVYVCGDVKAMAKDMHAMLLSVIADQAGQGADAAAAELRAMQRAGRYRRDVYSMDAAFLDGGPDHGGAQALLRTMLTVFPGRIAAVSFGTESAVVLHLLAEVDKAMPVIFIDTGKLFAETLRYRDVLVARLGLTDVRTVRPDPARLTGSDPDGDLWRDEPDVCCWNRKVVPLELALTGFAAWITGRKRMHGGARTGLDMVEPGPDGRIKVNPLAGWGAGDVARYFVRHGLPAHPLLAQGFRSVGCTICTTPVGTAVAPRDGRWAGSGKTECGIHLARAVITARSLSA